jgi:hypothetical protein
MWIGREKITEMPLKFEAEKYSPIQMSPHVMRVYKYF